MGIWNRGVRGQRIPVVVGSMGGVYSIGQIYDLAGNNEVKKPWVLSFSHVTEMTEGQPYTVTVNDAGLSSGDIDWALVNVSTDNNDVNPSNGTVTLSNGYGSFSITPNWDILVDPSETFHIQFTDPDTGSVLAETSAITITDVWKSPGLNISDQFHEISNRVIWSDQYMGNTNDYTGPYDVGSVEVDFSGVGRVYIGVKITASTTYYNDIPIAGVQIVSAGVLQQSWIFNNSAAGWTTLTQPTAAQPSIGFPITPHIAAGYNYYAVPVSNAQSNRFNLASHTGSSSTGSHGGVSGAYSTTLAPVGNSTVASDDSLYYLYAEASGTTRYTGTVMRSPTFSFIAGNPYEIRVIHAVTGTSGNPVDPLDSLYIGLR